MRLNNIRSYLDAEISFPEGSVLLAGDIGAGKSTVLQAIEFALFGFSRGELSGSSLLRKGCSSGFVELAFELDGQLIKIKRMLRQQKEGVAQSSGFLSIDGQQIELTPIELKARILGLLGYPEELLTKGKLQIFRYTVYTPQEAMKAILFEEPGTRLEALRRVFGVDRYGRIAQNAELVAARLRGLRRELAGQFYDLAQKEDEAAALASQLAALERKLDELKPSLSRKAQQLEQARAAVLRLESELAALDQLRQTAAALEARGVELQKKLDMLGRELAQLDLELARLSSSLVQPEVSSLSELDQAIARLEQDIASLDRLIGKSEMVKNQARRVKEKIAALTHCPTCLQEVRDEHKAKIDAEQTAIVREAEKRLSELALSRRDARDALQRLITRRGELAQHAERARLEKILKEQRARIEEAIALARAEYDGLEATKSELDGRLRAGHIEEQLKLARAELNHAIAAERELAVAVAAFEREKEGLLARSGALEQELAAKRAARVRAERLAQCQTFLEEGFVQLVAQIESTMLAALHSEFDQHFRRWVSILLEDEALAFRLDADFAPVVQQNGYDTELDALSGGERTACALAYRLALNKVINGIMSTIKTKGLLVLDEPTDGFSSEQLDKMRDVIDQLSVGQLIIVSHEPKLESFVQNIIRITKAGHVSRVLDS